MNQYLAEEILIEPDPVRDAYTIGEYTNDDMQTIEVEYADGFGKQVLYGAKPSCKHKIQAQWSGIKCTICSGWYCSQE